MVAAETAPEQSSHFRAVQQGCATPCSGAPYIRSDSQPQSMSGSVVNRHHSQRPCFGSTSRDNVRAAGLRVARLPVYSCNTAGYAHACSSKVLQACSAAASDAPAPLPASASSSHTQQPAITANVSQGSSAGQAMDLDTAWKYLKEFTVKMFRGLGAPYTSTREKRDYLRQALMLVYQSPWPPAGWVPPVARPTNSSQTAADISPQQQGGLSSSPEVSTNAPLVMIGLMAGDVKIGARALRDYCQALGLTYVIPEVRVAGAPKLADVQGSVYIKYNSVSKVCYVSPYQGRERGVLLQLGQEQLGHLPLGLFDEDMKNPPPPLE